MFSFHEGDDEAWKARIWAFSYRELFYLPEDRNLGIDEGMVRFDHAQVVPKRWLRRMKVALTDDVLAILTSWFQFYVTDIGDEWIREVVLPFRDECMKKIEENYGKETTG
jgi:hypothetical protein